MIKPFKWMQAPPAVPEEDIPEYIDTDVIVIGAGHAGTCAARAASEGGADVVVVEQQSDEHQWVLGIGEMGYMNSAWQKAHGVPEVDVDTFVNDWQMRTNNRSNYRLIRTYAENCGDCFDWFIEPLTEEEKESIHPMMTPLSEHMPETQNGIHAWSGTPNLGMKLMRKAVKENQRIAKEHGARFLFETTAVQLITAKGDGEINREAACPRESDGQTGDGEINREAACPRESDGQTGEGEINRQAAVARKLDGQTGDAVGTGEMCRDVEEMHFHEGMDTGEAGRGVEEMHFQEGCGSANARVTGAIVRNKDGQYVRINARKGVILAAGDYSKNREMCEDLLAECADLLDEGDFLGHGWDGSGIRMGVWAGGRLEPRPHASAGGNYSLPGFDTIGSTAGLRLNAHGKRYSNEGFGNHVLAAIPGAKQPNGMLWSIFDSNIMDEVTWQAPCNASFDYTDPERVGRFERSLMAAREARGTWVMNRDQAGDRRPLVCADTIEELARAVYADESDAQNMVAAVARYNELCEMGRDVDFGKEPFLLHPIKEPPFYASGQYKDSHRPFGQSMKILVTVGGLLTDEHQNVLGQDYEPIPGLYAAGNCCGGRFGLHYSTSIPGQSISMAETLGREVGRLLSATGDRH